MKSHRMEETTSRQSFLMIHFCNDGPTDVLHVTGAGSTSRSALWLARVQAVLDVTENRSKRMKGRQEPTDMALLLNR
jgi:hypothetical protein